MHTKMDIANLMEADCISHTVNYLTTLTDAKNCLKSVTYQLDHSELFHHTEEYSIDFNKKFKKALEEKCAELTKKENTIVEND